MKRSDRSLVETSHLQSALPRIILTTWQDFRQTRRRQPGLESDGVSQLGLVAEDVEEVNPDLVVRDKEGKPYSVRYDQVNAMLLNEFHKEHKKVEQQQANIEQLKSSAVRQEAINAQQQKGMETLAAHSESERTTGAEQSCTANGSESRKVACRTCPDRPTSY